MTPKTMESSDSPTNRAQIERTSKRNKRNSETGNGVEESWYAQAGRSIVRCVCVPTFLAHRFGQAAGWGQQQDHCTFLSLALRPSITALTPSKSPNCSN